jgi:hypothetical protein
MCSWARSSVFKVNFTSMASLCVSKPRSRKLGKWREYWWFDGYLPTAPYLAFSEQSKAHGSRKNPFRDLAGIDLNPDSVVICFCTQVMSKYRRIAWDVMRSPCADFRSFQKTLKSKITILLGVASVDLAKELLRAYISCPHRKHRYPTTIGPCFALK